MTQEILSSPAWQGIFDTTPASPIFSDNHAATPFERALHHPDASATQALGQLGVAGLASENHNDHEADGDTAIDDETDNGTVIDHEADDGIVIYRGLE